MEFTTVLGLDAVHFEQLKLVWHNWIHFKPDLLKNPLVVFCDWSVQSCEVDDFLQHPNFSLYRWPPAGTKYPVGTTKWDNQQRYKMLAGFVHIPARCVHTEYWLKLDTDTVATGVPNWIEERWFADTPAIVAHPWGYTKPPEQMLFLDRWISEKKIKPLYRTEPLNLKPEPGSDLVKHKRIISWCGFFNTEFTRQCSEIAWKTCGDGLLPVQSQDGYMFYMAKRGGCVIKRENMKARGWRHESRTSGIKKALDEVLALK